MSNLFIQSIGYAAQLIFGTRFFIQLWSSEKAGKVQSPAIFWQLSLLASMLLLIYSILVKDFPIMLGQMLGYFIYIRNLQIGNVWKKFPSFLRAFILMLPALSIIVVMSGKNYHLSDLIEKNSNMYLLVWGFTGQLVFTSRFLYQWIYSEKMKESVFPVAFWIFSIAGAVLISSYAWYMHLYPIIIGHAIGMIVYLRNLMIHFNHASKSSGNTI